MKSLFSAFEPVLAVALRLIVLGFCIGPVSSAIFAATCPQTKTEQDAWATNAIFTLVPAARTAFQDEDKNLTAYQGVLDRIARDLGQCKLAVDVDFYARHRELVDYLEVLALNRQPDHELGFSVPDQQYFAETRPYVQIPNFLLNARFLRAVSRWETLGEAKSILRQLNATRNPADQLIFFSYKSRHLGTPDNDDSFRRLLIVVPGNGAEGSMEKWVQFGITDPGARVRERNVSVVSAVAGPEGAFTSYFKDYFRTFQHDGSITVKGRWELGEGDDNCVKCHKSGILPIFPDKGSVAPGEQAAVEAVNQRFLTYGSPHFGKYLDPVKFGPGLGTANLEWRSIRFGKGFNNTDTGRAMSCAVCHRPDALGSLNWPMDETLISSFVTSGRMPLNHPVPAAERDELYEKLIAEYFAVDKANPGTLQAWLEGRMR